MAGLEGTIKTPVGPVSKKSAVYVGTAVAVLAAVVYYRHQQGTGAATTAAPADAEIDPATGYAYGSAEDLAALQAQGNYTTPVTSSPGGGSSIPNQGTGYVSNGAWSQAVIETLTTNGSVQDAGPLSQALGKYLSASYVAPGSNDDLLITQAIAQEGFPPVTGPNGMPPAINRNPPLSTGGGGGSSTPGTPKPATDDPTLPAPSHFKVTRADREGFALDWDPVTGAIGYQVWVNGKQNGETVTYSNDYVGGLHPNTSYHLVVYPVNKKNRRGHWSNLTARTKK